MSETQLLLVEDDDRLREIIVRHLRREGYMVTETGSAEGAVDALQAGLRPRLVILDLGLPLESGWDLLRRPDLANAGAPPVIVTTSTKVSPGRLAEFHVDAYLPKPFHLDALVDAIRRLAPAQRVSQP
jgi:two-component system OmpR family response regulator